MNPQIELARRYIEQTSVSLFLTGKAGTGKTTFLHDIDQHCNKRHVVLAPTGVAAVNAAGVTIHSFFQLPFDPYLPDVKELVTEYQMPQSHKSLSRTKLDIIRTLELLIIDEISMVRADLLDAIDMSLRRIRRSALPFGGVQLLLIGDVHQLSPVVTEHERPFIERVYPSPYFFNSKALQRIPYVTIELTTVYRQQDPQFVELLNNVRDGRMDQATLQALNSRLQPTGNRQLETGNRQLATGNWQPATGNRQLATGNLQPSTQPLTHSNIQTFSHSLPITLTTHNRQADAINRRHMDQLTGESRIFRAIVEGNFPETSMPIDRNLEIKVGERVMFIKNDSSGEYSYYNGKLATVVDFVKGKDCDLVQVIDDDGDTINVGRELWENQRYDIDNEGDIHQVVDGTFCQYPLRPAWAVTIHKAQGLTFDSVIIDAADAFAFGQVYVALSRCRTLQGLILSSPLSPRVTFGDASVSAFVSHQPSFAQVQQDVARCESDYYITQLTDLFSLGDILRQSERLDSLYSRLNNIYPAEVDSMHSLYGNLAQLSSVSEKFAAQIMRLPVEAHPDRVAKACQYYLPQLDTIAGTLSGLLDVEIDNKENRKIITEVGEHLSSMLQVKIACLRAVRKKGFSVLVVQKAKADALLSKPKPETRNRKPATNNRKLETGNWQPATGDQKLMQAIRNWRSMKASDEHLPPYTILQQKALVAIATNKPTTIAELSRQPGVGPKTVQKYAQELLDIVSDYIYSENQ